MESTWQDAYLHLTKGNLGGSWPNLTGTGINPPSLVTTAENASYHRHGAVAFSKKSATPWKEADFRGSAVCVCLCINLVHRYALQVNQSLKKWRARIIYKPLSKMQGKIWYLMCVTMIFCFKIGVWIWVPFLIMINTLSTVREWDPLADLSIVTQLINGTTEIQTHVRFMAKFTFFHCICRLQKK